MFRTIARRVTLSNRVANRILRPKSGVQAKLHIAAKTTPLLATKNSKYDEKKYHRQGHQYNYRHYTTYSAATMLAITPTIATQNTDTNHKKTTTLNILSEPMRATLSPTYPEVKDTPENEVFIQDDLSWYSLYIENRIYWIGTTVASLFTLPVGILNASSYFFTETYSRLHQEGITNFTDIIANTAITSLGMTLGATTTSIALTLFSAANILIPGFGREAIKFMILPADFVNASSINSDYPNAKRLSVKSSKGYVDAIDILHSDSEHYVIQFCATADTYHDALKSNIGQVLNSNLRLFNHEVRGSIHSAECQNDLFNAGIAQIYQLAKSRQWSNQEIAANITLSGHSFGGGVSLQVAAHFKVKFNIDIPVFVYNGFNSLNAVVAGLGNRVGIPVDFGNALGTLLLQASGKWDMDSIAAAKKLNPDMLHYVNSAHYHYPLFNPLTDNPVIIEGATFAEGMAANSSENVNSSDIVDKLKQKKSAHLVENVTTMVAAITQKTDFHFFKKKTMLRQTAAANLQTALLKK
jgi:hypothetical protein